jgi:beta-lactamase class A
METINKMKALSEKVVTFFQKKRNISLLLFLLALILTAFYAGQEYEKSITRDFLLHIRVIRAKDAGNPLVSPLVGVETPNAEALGLYSDQESQVRSYVKGEQRKGNVDYFSMYFRDLKTGTWFGIDEGKQYAPVSLFKLPLAIAVYKQLSDTNSGTTIYLPYTKDEDSSLRSLGKDIATSTLVIGNYYSVDTLVQKMLVNSDNGARNVLAAYVKSVYINDLFARLGVNPPLPGNDYSISPKIYSYFLRLLYNGSYLGVENSEKLLELLAKTTFVDGLVAGTPPGIPVAHKFGSLNLLNKETGQGIIGLHDCGIVYYPDRPYLICIMTQGKDQTDLARTIKTVSAMMFDEARTGY